MRLRTIGASLGVLALVGASLLVPATLANAAPPDSIEVTGTFGLPSVSDPRIGLQGIVDATPAASVQVFHSTDNFATAGTPWCVANVTVNSWACSGAAGGMLEHGPNYFQAVATNGDGTLTSATFSTPATTLDRTPTVTSPADGIVTNQTTLTFAGAAYPSTTLDVRTPTIQGVPGYPLCAPVSSTAGAWSCAADVSAIPDGTYSLVVEDLSGFVVNTTNEFTIDRTAPAAPVITSPPTPLTTTLTDHIPKLHSTIRR